MPSHTVHSALVSLFLEGQGAPWQYSNWQDITGVKNGLFPSDASQLPKGWTLVDSQTISSYFTQYSNVATEDAKIRFASSRSVGGVLPGRDKWRSWITSNWTKWKIHSRISEVLSSKEIHPLNLYTHHPELRNKQISSSYIPVALDDIGAMLYGEEALDSSGLLPFNVRMATQQIAQRTWMTLTKQLSRSKQRLASFEAIARVAFADLEHDKLTKAKISNVIRAVARWKSLAVHFQDEATLNLILQMDEELLRLMSVLGAKVKAPADKRVSSGKKLCNLENSALRSLAKQEDINDIINLYYDFFNVTSGADGMPIIDPHPLLLIPFGEALDGADPGVEVEATMAPEDLAHNLGFNDGLPLLFNKYRHLGGLLSWDPQYSALFDKPSEGIVPIQLHWHQLAGVHSIVRKSFNPQPDVDRCTGILLADEVGLGKTFQIGTLIAFLADVILRQERNLPLPPVIVENPYLADYKGLPQLPHLIVVPGTLLGQWEHELKVLLKPASFDILVYGSGRDNQSFWAASGPFYKSLHKSNKIVIASHSSLLYDYSKLYLSPRSSKGRLPWAPRVKRSEFDATVANTLYGQRFLTVTLDEAHEFRNNSKHSAALALAELAVLTVVATATPLQTSNQDSAAMGRLCGIPYFLSEEAFADEKIDATNLRRAKKEMIEMQQDLADDEIESRPHDHLQQQENPLKLCQIEISRRHQKQFQGRIIRRTINSRNWKGEPVLNLPECETVLGVVELTDREKEIITVLSDNVRDDVSTANGNKRISSKSFYIEYRMAVGYAQDVKGPVPRFNTLQEWRNAKSTKMDVVAQIIRHTLSSDAAPPVTFVDGLPIFPPVPVPEPGKAPSNKVAVFQDFPSLGSILRNVLDLYGIKHLYIDGQTSFGKRSQVVNQFNTDPNVRVLIFSSVGSVGLNLARANTIIFLDQPWSAQDERQIRGRVHRQPQKLKVFSYHILAKDTADVILSQQAQLYDLFSGKSLPFEGPEDDDEIEEDTAPEPKKRKGKAKVKKLEKSAKLGSQQHATSKAKEISGAGGSEVPQTDTELTSGLDTDVDISHSTSSGDVSMRSVGGSDTLSAPPVFSSLSSSRESGALPRKSQVMIKDTPHDRYPSRGQSASPIRYPTTPPPQPRTEPQMTLPGTNTGSWDSLFTPPPPGKNAESNVLLYKLRPPPPSRISQTQGNISALITPSKAPTNAAPSKRSNEAVQRRQLNLAVSPKPVSSTRFRPALSSNLGQSITVKEGRLRHQQEIRSLDRAHNTAQIASTVASSSSGVKFHTSNFSLRQEYEPPAEARLPKRMDQFMRPSSSAGAQLTKDVVHSKEKVRVPHLRIHPLIEAIPPKNKRKSTSQQLP